MSLIANRVLEMEESATLKMAALSWELMDQGKDVINLSLGEPDFFTPDFIKTAAKQAIDENYSYYPPIAGYNDLKKAICTKFKRDNSLSYTPEQIVVSTGAKHSLMNLCLALLNPGDEIILPAPYWVSYMAMAKFAQAKVTVIPTDVTSDFKITPKQLEEVLTEKSKVFLFSNPCNPSGSVYNEEELRALAVVFDQYPNCYIISDEIYELINFTDKNFSIAQVDGLKDRVITVNGLAKGFAMTGWRIGYIGAPVAVAKACTKIQGQFTSGANSIAQRAAITAVLQDPSSMGEMKEVFKKRRKLLLESLSDIPGMALNSPEGAFYLFPDVSSYFGKSYKGKTIQNASDFCLLLLENYFVAITDGGAFGCPKNIRISYASKEKDLENAVIRIKQFLAEIA